MIYQQFNLTILRDVGQSSCKSLGHVQGEWEGADVETKGM